MNIRFLLASSTLTRFSWVHFGLKLDFFQGDSGQYLEGNHDDGALHAGATGLHDAREERLVQVLRIDADESGRVLQCHQRRPGQLAAATGVVRILLEAHVAQVQHGGHRCVNGQLLALGHTQTRHGLVRRLEVFGVVEHRVAQRAPSAVLDALASRVHRTLRIG